MKSNKLKTFYKAIMLILLTAVITFLLTSTAMYNKYKNDNGEKVSQDEISKTFQLFRKYISQKYIGEINDEEMIESAIKGYVKGLGDEYSEYITTKEMKEYMEDTVGKYVGIGVYIANNTETDQIVVLMPIKGSPAEEVGILSGDVITKIDGIEYKGSQLAEASAALKQQEGTKVNVEVLRNDDTLNFEVERRTVKVNHIESKVIDDEIGYIDISSFDEGTFEEFEKTWNELKDKNVKSLIIDLRNNGGGIVQEALNIADMMIEKDKIMLITTSKGDKEEITKASKDKLIDLPIVILINEKTASSSEILAAAVKENNENVKIVGVNSYGKGVIQTIFSLYDGSGLKLTTNEYYTPNRNSINKKGIKPDEEVELPEGKTVYTVEENEDTQLQKAIELLK